MNDDEDTPPRTEHQQHQSQSQTLNSSYHRADAPFGHNHCPNCSEAYPPEFLYPVKVGKIVQIVWRQNKKEKHVARELARQTPHKLIQEHCLTQPSSTSRGGGGIGGDNNNNNSPDNNNNNITDHHHHGDFDHHDTVATTKRIEEEDPVLLPNADSALNELVPESLYNMKSPDWTELPPCIARLRLSLFQLRLNQKMMEKMTSLCENCFYEFFPDEDPTAAANNNNNNTGYNSPSPLGGSYTSLDLPPGSPLNTSGGSRRTPMKPSITFEQYIAQSRYPDRAKDMAYSDVGRAMRYAAHEHKLKTQLKSSLFSHIDRAQEMLMSTAENSSTGGGGGFMSPGGGIGTGTMDGGATGVTWVSENQFNGGDGTMVNFNNNNTNNNNTGSSNFVSRESRIRFLLNSENTLAEMVEQKAVDPLPITVLDVPFGDWLQRELWEEMNKVMQFGKDASLVSVTSSSSSSSSSASASSPNTTKTHGDGYGHHHHHQHHQQNEDVPKSHPFFELYSKNRLRLPNPASIIVKEGFETLRLTKWRSKTEEQKLAMEKEELMLQQQQQQQNNKKRDNSPNNNNKKKKNDQQQSPSSSPPTTPATTNPRINTTSSNNNKNNNNATTSSFNYDFLFSPSPCKKLEESYARDQTKARTLSIPENLNDQERRCLTDIMCGVSLSDSAKNDNESDKKILCMNPQQQQRKMNQYKYNINNTSSSFSSAAGHDTTTLTSNSSGAIYPHQYHTNNNNISSNNNSNIDNISGFPRVASSNKSTSSPNSSSAHVFQQQQLLGNTQPWTGGQQQQQQQQKSSNTNIPSNISELPSAIEDFLESPV